MALIPGLHNHGAWQSLMRLPYDQFDEAKKVSHRWKAEIELPFFHKSRRALGLTQAAIVVVQCWEDPSIKPFCPNHIDLSKFRLALFTQKTGIWSYIPPLPEYPDGFPPFCKVVGAGIELIVLGGSDPENFRNHLDSVFIFNFLSGEWRRGASMPDREQILNFGCCSDFENIVYVVGGSGNYRKASKSVMAYNVAENTWTRLPNMAKAREGCNVWFCEGKLQIIHETGYFQGQPKTEIEVLDVNKGCWDSFVTESGVCKGIYAEGRERGIYKCCGESRKIFMKQGDTWKVMTELPPKVESVYFASIWGNKLIVLCSFEYVDSVEAFTVDLKTLVWRKMDTVPEEYTKNITSGCYLEI